MIKKFKVDKRKSHLSCLIRNSELTREEALNILSNNRYPGNLDNDIKYFCKKLDFDMSEFEKIMNEEIVPHNAFGNSERIFKFSKKIFNIFKKI